MKLLLLLCLLSLTWCSSYLYPYPARLYLLCSLWLFWKYGRSFSVMGCYMSWWPDSMQALYRSLSSYNCRSFWLLSARIGRLTLFLDSSWISFSDSFCGSCLMGLVAAVGCSSDFFSSSCSAAYFLTARWLACPPNFLAIYSRRATSRRVRPM